MRVIIIGKSGIKYVVKQEMSEKEALELQDTIYSSLKISNSIFTESGFVLCSEVEACAVGKDSLL